MKTNLAALLEVAPYVGQPIPAGVIRSEGTIFRRCRFVDVTIAGTREQIALWKNENRIEAGQR